MDVGRRFRPSTTSSRRKGVIGILLAAATAGVALLGYSRDPSPLAGVPVHLAAARNVAYGPDAHQTLDLLHARDVARPRPAIVMIHPGGWIQGDKSAYHPLMLQYAELGYVTVSVNFRPAPFPAAVRDCKRAVRWLRAHATSYGVDPSRVGVTGWSSGAHLAMMVALSDDAFETDDGWPGVSSRVQAAVGFAGVYDFLMESSGRFPNREDDPVVVRFLGGPPRGNPDLARRASPLHHLSADDPPLLIFHGELDRRIDAEQARHFATASKALGRGDEVVLLPAVDHGRDVLPPDPRDRDRVRDFFAKRLAP